MAAREQGEFQACPALGRRGSEMREGFTRLLPTLVWLGILAAYSMAQGQDPPRPPTSVTLTPSPPARVVRVVDGDTLVLSLDGRSTTVRLIGLDTPETVHPTKPVERFGREA